MTLEAKRAVVLGMGISGLAAAEALLTRGVSVSAVHVTEQGEELPAHVAQTARSLADRGAQVWLGETPDGLFEDAELIVVSPGLPPSSEIVKQAVGSGVTVVGEIELGWMLGERDVIAVTGTNGKTTTTSLIAHILDSARIPAVTTGNIGQPFSRSVEEHPPETVFVCEVSSAQLHFTDGFRPGIAVILNIADDHYDWHGSPQEYVQAKAKITSAQTAEDLLVILAGDTGCMAAASSSKARIAAFGLSAPEEVRAEVENGINRAVEIVGGMQGDVLVVESSDLREEIALSDIRLTGRHNLENVLAASIAALAKGASGASIAPALRTFEGLPHRMHLVRERNGVRYIDDSKATNPHAALRALEGLENVVLIAGGRSKGLDMGVLVGAADRLDAIVAIGEASDELAEAFEERVHVHKSANIEEAVNKAASLAGPGSTVLLSPACASWDQFASYAERGDRFRAAVEAL